MRLQCNGDLAKSCMCAARRKIERKWDRFPLFAYSALRAAVVFQDTVWPEMRQARRIPDAATCVVCQKPKSWGTGYADYDDDNGGSDEYHDDEYNDVIIRRMQRKILRSADGAQKIIWT